MRRALLAFFFWLKALLALLLSIAIFALYTNELIQRRSNALAQQLPGFTPISGINPLNPVTGDDKIPGIPNGGAANIQCIPNPLSTGKLTPPPGLTYYGFSLPWTIGTLPSDTRPLFGGRNSAIFNAYFNFDLTKTPHYDINMLNWKGSEAGKVGAILIVTLDPQNPGVVIPDSAFDQITDQFATINAVYGAPILVRWGHEMNGYWYTAYAGRPLAYIQGYPS